MATTKKAAASAAATSTTSASGAAEMTITKSELTKMAAKEADITQDESKKVIDAFMQGIVTVRHGTKRNPNRMYIGNCFFVSLGWVFFVCVLVSHITNTFCYCHFFVFLACRIWWLGKLSTCPRLVASLHTRVRLVPDVILLPVKLCQFLKRLVSVSRDTKL
jgi:hypothetical protein